MSTPRERAIGRLEIVVPESAIDRNGHVNNVRYVQWMQDAAEAHSASLGWPTERYAALGRAQCTQICAVDVGPLSGKDERPL